MITIKSDYELSLMRKASKIVYDTHKYIKEFIKPGITTKELNDLAHDYIVREGAYPSCLGYEGYPDWAKKRFLMRPGMTGLAQIKTRTTAPWDERIVIDNEYVDTFNVLLDAKIIFKTFAVMSSPIIPLPRVTPFTNFPFSY